MNAPSDFNCIIFNDIPLTIFMIQAQAQHRPVQAAPTAPYPTLLPFSTAGYPQQPLATPEQMHAAYPALADMGLVLTEQEMAFINSGPVALPAQSHVSLYEPKSAAGSMIAPISGTSVGYHAAQVTHGIREVVLCKDKNDKVGMKVAAVNKGVFVVLVSKDSPAAMAGLRFGDQILQIDGENLAGYSMDKVHGMIRRSPVNGIRLVVRDRPFERTITLHKDSAGTTGFHFKNGKIDTIVKDSSAARNGLLTDHQLLEVNGQNVVGLDDKVAKKIISESPGVVTLTLMPSIIYDHLIKK
jgi:syntenin-1